MKRGRFNATVYVFLAFLMQAALLACPLALPSALIPTTVVDDEQTRSIVLYIGLTLGGTLGLLGAYLTFRDRWKCIEAFSSRYCAGVMNLSLLYVPWIALVYANVRAFRKLAGR